MREIIFGADSMSLARIVSVCRGLKRSNDKEIKRDIYYRAMSNHVIICFKRNTLIMN